MNSPLIPKSEFIGLEDLAHLAAGGESPMLASHRQAVDQFMIDKAKGEDARLLEAEAVERTRSKCAQLFSVDPTHITFLSNASEGINNIAYGLNWEAGDNVVVADIEFPSDILPWTRLRDAGVETRIVKNKDWFLNLEDFASLINDRTRIVAVSHVSMYTGQRMNLEKLSEIVRASNARLLLDVTHSAGVVPVDGRLADVIVCSCYKWLLGVHGAAIFYLDRAKFPDFEPPFLGWNSPRKHGGWKDPTTFELQDTAHRFQPGNASFISIYILENALNRLMDIGIDAIEDHVHQLNDKLIKAIPEMGFELMTPVGRADRAGNVCFSTDKIGAIKSTLESNNVLIWGAYAGFGRLRISSHLYNDSGDIERCLSALGKSVN